MTGRTHLPGRLRGEGGFSLIEVLVAIVIMVVAVLGMLALFDRSNRMSKVENNVTDEQQSARYASYQVVRELRMTGAGAVPASIAVGGISQLGLSLTLGSTTYNDGKLSNNVGNDVFIGPASSIYHVRQGTDFLHVRGVITNALYDLGSSSWIPPSGGTPGTLVIQPCTKFTDPTATAGTPCYPNGRNDMSVFASSTSYPVNRLFVMSDQLGNVGVGLITNVSVGPAVPATNGNVATLTISTADPYVQSLNAGNAFPAGLTNPSRGGVMDDRVYFITDGPAGGVNCPATGAVAVQSPGPCHPVLMVADWGPTAPGATNPFGGDGVTVTPIADDIEDLQVAYGDDFYDVNTDTGSFTSPAPAEIDPITGQPRPYPSDGSISITTKATFTNIITASQGSSPPNADPSEDASAAGLDEWLGNHSGEIAIGTFDWTSDLSRIRSLEIGVLAKAKDPDPKSAGPGSRAWKLLDSTAVTVSDPTSGNNLPYHRRAQTVRVDLRNFQTQ